jgi:sulfocyanin
MIRIRRLAAATAVAGLLATLGVPGGGTGRAVAAGPVAAFPVIAAQTAANGEMNYDGTTKGQLVITVPLGAAVQLTLSNKGTLPHSLQIIPFTDRLPAAAVPTPAFPGAQTKDPQAGITKGQTEVVQFTASKAGRYLMICGFPGHALLGMYGIFEVSPKADTKPTLVIKK